MKYATCLSCDKLWHRRANDEKCNGPNFMACDVAELSQWCNAYIDVRPGDKLTAEKISTLSKGRVSKSTVYNFLSLSHENFTYETIRSILETICGGEWGDYPCGNLAEGERAAYEKKIAELKEALNVTQNNSIKELQWRDDKIQFLMTEHTRSLEDLSGRVGRHQDTLEFQRNEINKKNEEIEHKNQEIKHKNRIITIMGITSGVLLLVIIAMLIKWWLL